MNKTLILTGWSKTVYMTAAAAALEALKWKADVAGVSMVALAGALMISRKQSGCTRRPSSRSTAGIFRPSERRLAYPSTRLRNTWPNPSSFDESRQDLTRNGGRMMCHSADNHEFSTNLHGLMCVHASLAYYLLLL